LETAQHTPIGAAVIRHVTEQADAAPKAADNVRHTRKLPIQRRGPEQQALTQHAAIGAVSAARQHDVRKAVCVEVGTAIERRRDK
jgi:hypothetical protein